MQNSSPQIFLRDIDPFTNELPTERLILEKIRLSDAESFAINYNNINVIKRYSQYDCLPFTVNNAINSIQYRMNNPNNITFAIKLKTKPGETIGAISICKWNNKDEVHVDYWLGENFWRKGIMSEALQALLFYAFNTLNLEKINA